MFGFMILSMQCDSHNDGNNKLKSYCFFVLCTYWKI